MSLKEFREMLKESGEDVDDMTEEELMKRMDELEGGESDDSEEGSAAGPPSKRRKGRHPTLSDYLFSIGELKRLIEEAEADLLIYGRLAVASTMLAPQELSAAPSSTHLVARSELTSEKAQKLRNKHRKHKEAPRKKLGEIEELYGKKRKSFREEKDEALKGLVKSGKGVTIVGKGAKEIEKGKKRG
ncbi:hypothetical protein D1P53_004810 [Cryptococcus gattii VGV]|nr:hypothetical protein D1P53_004810 [Cryptococcus gattii VGV]